MQIVQYTAFINRSDQFADLPNDVRKKINIQGLMSEIGSVVSAIKKETLREGGALNSAVARAELEEELGDVMWYAFSLARQEFSGTDTDLLKNDIEKLVREVGNNNERGSRIREVLSPERAAEFLDAAANLPPLETRTFGDYQKVAFNTARTDDDTLLTVCSAVLSQLGAQLMRHTLPDVELELNTQLQDRDISAILGAIAWHVAAVASLYSISLDAVAQKNVEKNRFRRPSGPPTPLHDEADPEEEQLPRYMEIDIVSVSDTVSEMRWQGDPFGDQLKDNAYEPDGYRFHDVMHLANAAHLGWSPVLRKLIRTKRESDKTVDEVEDGGRAAVVEEAIVKVIHCEAARVAGLRQPDVLAENRTLFPEDETIPFSLLKLVHQLSIGHEPFTNKYWEWENAIRDGYKLFQLFREHKEGRVVVDLKARSVEFKPIV
ncbi:hypothetical protein D1224_10710 [Henriciella barbarensis]|uniref:MazG C-terminal domain-containing protein n=1 Tax=Henriciella barbarensis TaxID=86342 RepID=A0A399R5G2_9PROT|nr:MULTISPECIES: MazG nucleotide pyrophosphohydrolase domain-containing protein [Henriciella]RIJ24669.1 hypothetical protein D1224_10710 [Henriciella barbarensis]